MTQRNNQSGFTMVEVLVALVVLAIGLLGIAALYLNSLQSGRTAIYRTEAVTLAADLADRIRMNRTAQAAYGTLFADAEVAVPACATTGGCSDADLAATDLSNWKADGRPAPAERPGAGGGDAAGRARRADHLRRHRALGRSRRSRTGDLPARVPDMKTIRMTNLRRRAARPEPRRTDGGPRHRHVPARRHDHGLRQDPRPVPHERRRGPPAGNGALRDGHDRGRPAHGELLGPHEPRGPHRERPAPRPRESPRSRPDLLAAGGTDRAMPGPSTSAAPCGRSSFPPTSRRTTPTRSAAGNSARRSPAPTR